MAGKVTPQDIAKFNELYYKLKTYAAVARETGFSASTVKRYIDPNWTPVDTSTFKRVHLSDVPKFSTARFDGLDNYGTLCIYATEELKEVEEFWKELSV